MPITQKVDDDNERMQESSPVNLQEKRSWKLQWKVKSGRTLCHQARHMTLYPCFLLSCFHATLFITILYFLLFTAIYQLSNYCNVFNCLMDTETEMFSWTEDKRFVCNCSLSCAVCILCFSMVQLYVQGQKSFSVWSVEMFPIFLSLQVWYGCNIRGVWLFCWALILS